MDDEFYKEMSDAFASAMSGRDGLKAGDGVLGRCLDNAEDVTTARIVFLGIYEWLRNGKSFMCLEKPFNDETLNTLLAVVFGELEKKVGTGANCGSGTLEEMAERSCRVCEQSHSDEWERIMEDAKKGKEI